MILSLAMIDVKWLEALKLPLKAMLGIAFSSGALLILDQFKGLDLDVFSPIMRPSVQAVFTVSAILSIVGIVDLLLAPVREKRKQSQLSTRRAVRQEEKKTQRAEVEKRRLAYLDNLSKEEIHYVADCLRKGTPTFYTYLYSPPVSMLQGKGLVWTPGGTHNRDYYPFSFEDFVWEALLARKVEFIAKDDEHKRADRARR